MISVVVYINHQPVIVRYAINVSPDSLSDNKSHEYHVDDGRKIKHVRKTGAAKLAIKMLQGIVDL